MANTWRTHRSSTQKSHGFDWSFPPGSHYGATRCAPHRPKCRPEILAETWRAIETFVLPMAHISIQLEVLECCTAHTLDNHKNCHLWKAICAIRGAASLYQKHFGNFDDDPSFTNPVCGCLHQSPLSPHIRGTYCFPHTVHAHHF